MAQFPYPRATVLIASGPAHDPDRKHLFIVLTEPLGEPPEVLLVSLSSVTDGSPCDASCLIEVGEHQFVLHQSFVAYRFARIVRAEVLRSGVDSGKFVAREPVSEALYRRICDGLRASPHVAPKFRSHLQWHENL